MKSRTCPARFTCLSALGRGDCETCAFEEIFGKQRKKIKKLKEKCEELHSENEVLRESILLLGGSPCTQLPVKHKERKNHDKKHS